MSSENNVNDINGALDWDSPLSADYSGSRLLPEGDYDFTVTDFNRGWYPGGAKMCACPKAQLVLQVKMADEEKVDVKTDLILHNRMQWQLSGFFRSIGRPVTAEGMNWDNIIGCQGRAHFAPRTYTGRDGNERKINNVARYIDYNPADHDKNYDPKDPWMPADDTQPLPF